MTSLVFRWLGALLAAASVATSLNAEEACKGRARPPDFQQVGLAPAGSFAVGNSVFLIDDASAASAVVACDVDNGGSFHFQGRWPLPKGFHVKSIGLSGDHISLRSEIDTTLDLPLGTLRDGGLESLPGANTSSIEGLSFAADQLPNDALKLTIPLSAREAPSPPEFQFELKPLAPEAKIFTRKVLSVNAAVGTATVYWDEVGQQTRAFVATFDRAGAMVAGAEIPIGKMDTVPEHLAGALADGRVYYIYVKGDESFPVMLRLDPGFATTVGAPEPQESPPPPPPPGAGPEEPEFQDAVRKLIGEDGAEAPAPPVSRASIVECARRFSTFKWKMTPKAYEHDGVENLCEPEVNKYWRRPSYLEDTVGKEISGIPYCWGCSDSLDRFTTRVAAGSHLAGHSCTCRTGKYCLRSDVTGVDCSGFVSQCWKSGYYQTSRMGEIADTISKVALKAGDALNLSGSHIRLFIEFVQTPQGRKFRVIEAANAQGSIGRVVESVYTAAQLNSYKAIRYRRVTD